MSAVLRHEERVRAAARQAASPKVARPVQRLSGRGALDAATVLRLQRLAGNGSVATLLRDEAPEEEPEEVQALGLQRDCGCGGTCGACSGAEAAGPDAAGTSAG